MSNNGYEVVAAIAAHSKFESLVKECVERNLGCTTWEGLAAKRVSCVGGVFLVDGVEVCKTTPVVFDGGSFKFNFEDLTK